MQSLKPLQEVVCGPSLLYTCKCHFKQQLKSLPEDEHVLCECEADVI